MTPPSFSRWALELCRSLLLRCASCTTGHPSNHLFQRVLSQFKEMSLWILIYWVQQRANWLKKWLYREQQNCGIKVMHRNHRNTNSGWGTFPCSQGDPYGRGLCRLGPALPADFQPAVLTVMTCLTCWQLLNRATRPSILRSREGLVRRPPLSRFSEQGQTM